LKRTNIYKILISLVLLGFSLQVDIWAEEDKDNDFLFEGYFRQDIVSFSNCWDLNKKAKDDRSTYFGLDYSFSLTKEWKTSGAKLYLKLERNGPYDYDMPLFVHNTLKTSSAEVASYRNEELLPQLEEFWWDVPIFGQAHLKSGLFSYDVGEGFSLNGGYENFGLLVYQGKENFSWRLYYCRPDIVYKNPLGPHILQEESQGIDYEPNAANFLAADIKIIHGQRTVQPYVGTLIDYTSSEKRQSLFAAPIERDILGTLGIYWKEGLGRFNFVFELAHNFGQAKTKNSDYKDIIHTGYLFYQKIEYSLPKMSYFLQFLLASGNKVDLESAVNQDEKLVTGKNRAFSYYSLANLNLGDSISSLNSDSRPIVSMGTGYGLNYGLSRPGSFSAADFDNIILPAIGIKLDFTPWICLQLSGYYLRCFEPGVGVFNGQPKRLSRELGYEIDSILDFRISKNTVFTIMGGYFLPGQYYKELRDDTDGSLLSPFVRGDGKADPAYQIELAWEFSF